MRKLLHREIAPTKIKLLERQLGACALCFQSISEETAVLDHDHKTGVIRAALCRNCNGIEGKVFNLARRAKRKFDEPWFIKRLLAYWELHETDQTGLLHPLHKTADEKRLTTNAKARKKRATNKV